MQGMGTRLGMGKVLLYIAIGLQRACMMDSRAVQVDSGLSSSDKERSSHN